MKEEFEKYWKEKFDHFEVKPSSNLWNRVNYSLFEKQTKLLFKNYFTNPSKNVWKKIHFILWWKEFSKFSSTTFNIYYLLFSILTATGIIFYSYNYKTHKSLHHAINHNSEEQKINNTRSLASILDEVEYHNLPTTNQTIISNKNTFKAVKHNNTPNTQSVFYFEKENISYIPPITSSELTNNINSNDLTNRVEAYKLKNHSHSFAIHFSPVLLNHTYYFQKNETFKQDSSFKLLDANSYGISAWYSYQQNYLSLNSGIIFQSVKQEYAFNNPIIYTDTIRIAEIIDQSYYQYSYIQVLNLDTLLLTGDTVWFTHIDSTLVFQLDTLWNTEIKEIRKNREARHYFSYKTIELPILIGYTQTFDRIAISFKTGLSLSHTILTTGTLPSPSSDYGSTPFVRKHFKWLHLNALFAIETQYALSEEWSVAIIPMYKRNITNLLKDSSPINLKTNSWFINFGIKYHLK